MKFLKLFVGNIPWTVANNDLRLHFSKFGPVVQSSVVFDHNVGMSKGYGFVIYGNKEGYNAALKASEHRIDGRNVNVEPANS